MSMPASTYVNRAPLLVGDGIIDEPEFWTILKTPAVDRYTTLFSHQFIADGIENTFALPSGQTPMQVFVQGLEPTPQYSVFHSKVKFSESLRPGTVVTIVTLKGE